MEIQDFIDDINNGLIEDVKKYFNDLNTFFHILKKRGLLDEIDIEGGSDACQNELLLFFYETDKEKFYYWVNHSMVESCKLFSRVSVPSGACFSNLNNSS